MRRITMVALATVLALSGAACGGDDDSGTPETEATDDGGATDDGATTDDGGDGGADAGLGLIDEDCQFLLAGSFLNPAAALMSGQADDVEDASSNLEEIADAAPDEIAEDMEVLAAGYAEMIEALGDIDLSDPQALTDPAVQQQFDELEDVFDEEYEEAAQAVQDYVEESCTPG